MQSLLPLQVPLSWPGSYPVNTTYKDSFPVPCGGGIERPPRVDPHAFTSCPTGALNMRLAGSQLRASYPLPERFSQKMRFPLPQDESSDNRRSYYAR